jgi:2-polyprenyl-6-methoxyphenol hydroxylase-like FAD-dependent oxidoreductase
MRVVICGGGVVGACTAYFLSQRGAQVIVVESTEVAAAASGKAGGFLALDWCAGTPLDALARRSFQLHADLPQEIADDWGYRPMTAYGGFVVSQSDPRRQKPSELDWLSNGVVIASRLSTTETTAIVHPRMFTSAMMRAAQARGAELRRGRATGVMGHTHATTMRGVKVDGNVIEANAVVVARGPWSLLAAEWMSLPAVLAVWSHPSVMQMAEHTPSVMTAISRSSRLPNPSRSQSLISFLALCERTMMDIVFSLTSGSRTIRVPDSEAELLEHYQRSCRMPSVSLPTPNGCRKERTTSGRSNASGRCEGVDVRVCPIGKYGRVHQGQAMRRWLLAAGFASKASSLNFTALC